MGFSLFFSLSLTFLIINEAICGGNPELDNPCEDQPTPCANEGEGTRFYFEPTSKYCIPTNCEFEGGFDDVETCRKECEKRRPARKVSANNKFGVLADFEITAPKKLSLATRRKFPLSLCELEWDSGLICPGIRRGSYLDQFHYDQKGNTCEHFIYNGCGGNANRFFTLWECIQSCVKKSFNRIN